MTTDMNIEQERAAFEAWAKGHYILQRSAYNDTYIAVPTIRAWEVWQARAVLQSEQVQAWKRDAERMEWYFGSADKSPWMPEYMRGCNDGWSVDQWRMSIDAAMEKQK